MRTLFVTRWRPHRPDGGAQLRNAQNIAALTRLGTVDVLSIGREETVDRVEGIGAWHHFRRRNPNGMLLRPGCHPLIDAYHTLEAERCLDKLLAHGHCDLAVVEEISLARYIAPIRATGTRVVFDAHNVEARLRAEIGANATARWRTRIRRSILNRRLARIECNAVATADLVWACSSVDADALVELHRQSTPVAVVPNAVDTRAFADARAGQTQPVPAGAPISLVYTGTYPYAPNAAAALELIRDVLPALRAAGERVKLALVGREPTPAMVAAAATDPDVTLTGEVPSILPWLAVPCLMPLPIRQGSGTRLKILEAFAAGCAVVGTAKAAEGLEVADGRNIRLAETPAAFAVAIRALWHDPAARAAQASAAFRLVEEHYSWPAAARAIEGSLRTLPGLGLPEPEAA